MNSQQKIPLSYSSIDFQALAKVQLRFANASHQEILEAFEAKLCEVTKSPYALALNSGTGGIHLALQVLGVGKDDDVPVSTFTYVGSVNPIRYQNARPVFIDSERETWNMDPGLLEDYMKATSAKNKLPKAIEVVHTYGMPAQMTEIMEVASRFEIPIIEDAAAGLGASWQGIPVGSIGDIGVFSFNNNKTITTFGGGALLTKNRKIYDRAKFLASQARENKQHYEYQEVGYNYLMGPLNAMYGLSQLELLDKKVEARRAIHGNYSEGLKDVPEILFRQEPDHYYSSRWLSAMLIESPSVSKEALRATLEKNGIESRYLWKPMHQQPVFADFHYVGSGFSERLFERGLCLPSGQELSQHEQDQIVQLIKDQFSRLRSSVKH